MLTPRPPFALGGQTISLLSRKQSRIVVLQLQDSCRESRSESQELRQEIVRLRHEFRERDKLWKALGRPGSLASPQRQTISPLYPPHSPSPAGCGEHSNGHPTSTTLWHGLSPYR
ncbi:hypothetical protein BD779DRAFT_32414 [Infundibulicybe gibba]|nr:hypothetical protein BD779DRAFT_32414 [Infundibulicybe gibba]